MRYSLLALVLLSLILCSCTQDYKVVYTTKHEQIIMHIKAETSVEASNKAYMMLTNDQKRYWKPINVTVKKI